ncbi:MAG: hypothetical protein ACE5EF_00070 [Dehalococcoidia bacterium]
MVSSAYTYGRGIQSVDHHLPPDGRPWNPSYSYTWNASGELTQIEATQDGITLRRTITWTGGDLTGVGPWLRI